MRKIYIVLSPVELIEEKKNKCLAKIIITECIKTRIHLIKEDSLSPTIPTKIHAKHIIRARL